MTTFVRELRRFVVPPPFGGGGERLGGVRLLRDHFVIGSQLMPDHGMRLDTSGAHVGLVPGRGAPMRCGLYWQSLERDASESALVEMPPFETDLEWSVIPLCWSGSRLGFFEQTFAPYQPRQHRFGVIDVERRSFEFHSKDDGCSEMEFAFDGGLLAWREGDALEWVDLRDGSTGNHRFVVHGALRAIDGRSFDTAHLADQVVLVAEKSGTIVARWHLDDRVSHLRLHREQGLVIACSWEAVFALTADERRTKLSIAPTEHLQFDVRRNRMVAVRAGIWVEAPLDGGPPVQHPLPVGEICDVDLDRRLLLLERRTEHESVFQLFEVSV